MPSVLVATKIVEPLYIIYPGFKNVAWSFASTVADSAAEASPVYCTLEFAVAIEVKLASIGRTLTSKPEHRFWHGIDAVGPAPVFGRDVSVLCSLESVRPIIG